MWMKACRNIDIMRYAPQIVFGGLTGEICFSYFDFEIFIRMAV